MKNEEKGFFAGSAAMNKDADILLMLDVSKTEDGRVKATIVKPREAIVYHDLVEKGAKTYEIQATDGVLYLAVLGEENSTGSFVRSSKVVNGKYFVSVNSNPRVIEELTSRLDRIFPTSKLIDAAGVSVIILSQYNGAVNYAEWRSKGV